MFKKHINNKMHLSINSKLIQFYFKIHVMIQKIVIKLR